MVQSVAFCKSLEAMVVVNKVVSIKTEEELSSLKVNPVSWIKSKKFQDLRATGKDTSLQRINLTHLHRDFSFSKERLYPGF